MVCFLRYSLSTTTLFSFTLRGESETKACMQTAYLGNNIQKGGVQDKASDTEKKEKPM